jgi:hypothetical protein
MATRRITGNSAQLRPRRQYPSARPGQLRSRNVGQSQVAFAGAAAVVVGDGVVVVAAGGGAAAAGVAAAGAAGLDQVA